MKHNLLIIIGLFLSIFFIIWLNFFEKYLIPVSLQFDYEKVNTLIETISIAYLTSYIFYSVVVIFKEKQDKKVIFPFIADYTYIAMNNCIHFCSSMRNWAGLKNIESKTGIYNRNNKIYPTEDELNIICSIINPNEKKNKEIELEGFRTIPHFFGVMIKYAIDIDYYLKIVLEKSNFMDTELVRILTDIKTHGYHQWLVSYDKTLVYTAKHRHDNLKVFEKSLLSYFNLFRRLELYAENNLKKYVERESLKQ